MRTPCMRPQRHRDGGRIALAIALVVCILSIVPSAKTDEPLVFAITNAKLVPISSPPVEQGTIVIRNGIIEAVGTQLSLPGDARVIDAKGMVVYPGFIDSLSDITLEEARGQPTPSSRPGMAPSGVTQTQAQAPAGSPEERAGVTPFLQAADLINASSSRLAAARSAGITTALVIPRRGFFQGQSALVNLSGTSPGEMIVKTPVALHVGTTSGDGSRGAYPSSLMGVFACIRQTLLDAQNYEIAWSIYSANPGASRPPYSRVSQALQPALKGLIPVVFPGATREEIQRALNLGAAFNLNLILSGGTEAGKIGAVLREKKVPVLLSVRFPERDRDADPEEEEELRDLRRRVEAPENAAALAKAGVRFAFQSTDIANPRDFIRNITRAVRAGLDKDVALRSLTLTPAEIFGVADRLGSIDKGKCANIVIATGDIFDPRTRVKYVFVDGRRFEITETEPPRSTEAAATAGPTIASGTWTLRLASAQGLVDITLRIRQEGSVLSGTVTSPLGTHPISEGAVSGNELNFKVNANMPGGGDMVVSFTGTVQGNNITGSVDLGPMGKMDFTGSRDPDV